MSIGKSSIARAVNATNVAAKAQNKPNENVSVSKLPISSIGLLSVAKTADDISGIKSSVEKRGMLCPVLVAATNKGDLWLVDGYIRLAAAKELSFEQINAVVINVDTKTQANTIYNEIHKALSAAPKADNNIHEEKFRIVAIKDRDLPVHLL